MALGDFTPQVAAYAARPGYPEALLDRLLVAAGVAAGDRVADVGAGTGIFTAQLSARGLAIDAVEPNPSMSAQAPALPGVTWHAGSFEATALPAGSVRWVTAAQAFHWADPPRALPELHRILVPGGHLTVLWNDRRDDASPLLAATRAVIRARAPGFDELYRARDWATELTAGAWFGDVVADEEPHEVVMSRERYRTLWRSHNRLAEAADADLPAVLAGIDALVDGLDRDDIAIPYTTRAWTARALAR